MKRIITLLMLTPCASAQSSLESLGYVALGFGILALLYSYHLTQTKKGLEAQIAKEKGILRRLQDEVTANQEIIERQGSEALRGSRLSDEIKKTEGIITAKTKQDGLRKEYWERLEQMTSHTTEETELKRLLDERAETQSMIELTKEKYHTRAIDEKSFSDITGEYQKKLIELETRIRKLKGRKNGD
jgi:hypothetical protein